MLLCSALLTANYMGFLPHGDTPGLHDGPSAGYSQRLRHLENRNALSDALAKLNKKNRREKIEFWSPQVINEIVVELRSFDKIPENLTVEELLAYLGSIYEFDVANYGRAQIVSDPASVSQQE